MKAVIMAGGEGTRLRPLTCNKPKPMVPVVNKPVMEHIVMLLKKYNIYDIAVTLQYMPQIIKDYFRNGEDFGVNIEYFEEKVPLGTAGSVKNAESFLNDTFVVISGDALTDIDLSKAIAFHKEKQSKATLVLKKVDIPIEYGIVVLDSNNKIIKFLEKPSWGEVFSDTANTGIYILSNEIFKLYEKDQVFDFSKDLFPILLKENIPIYGYVTEDYWCDIGDINAYINVHYDIMENKVNINLSENSVRKGLWLGENVYIEDDVVINTPAIIGKNTKVKKNTIIDSFSVIGENCVLEERCKLKRAILWKNCHIKSSANLKGAVLCDKVYIKENASVFETSVIGENTEVGQNTIIYPGVKIWPSKTIENTSTVKDNVIWGTIYKNTVFGERGIKGNINIDITPEIGSKLAAAFGWVFKNNSNILVSCDQFPSSHMIKDSFILGLKSIGAKVSKLENTLLPIARNAITFYKLDGGIYVGASTSDNSKIHIEFLNEKGSNIDKSTERKIENTLLREEFVRCNGNDIKCVTSIDGYNDFYKHSLINSVKTKKIKYKIALNIGQGMIQNILLNILQTFNTNVKVFKESNQKESLFSEFVMKNNFDFGIFIDEDCENLSITCNDGNIINGEKLNILMSIIFFKTAKGRTLVAPISMPSVLEKIVEENEGRLVKSKTSHQDFMSKIFENSYYNLVPEQFLMHFDALSCLMMILDYLSLNNLNIEDLINIIPEFYIEKSQVKCPWNAKGKVIRRIIEESHGEKIEAFDGVKILLDKGWTLVLPDSEKATCNIISEGYTSEFAKELTDFYTEKITKIINE